MFAPSDEAFARLSDDALARLRDERHRTELRAFLKRHVVRGRVYAQDAIRTGSLVTLDGARVAFTIRDGREMLDSVRHVSEGQPLRLRVGVADVIPKLMARRLLQPALELDRPVHLICHEAKAARLETELAAHTYDVVLTDAPLSGRSRIRAFSHPLGKCGVVFQAAPELARRYRRGFPGSLDDAPMLLPTDTHVLRSQLERWFSKQGVRPHVVAEFEDTALLKEFAADGLGVFAVPDVIEDDVRKRCGTRVVGRAPLEERIYAISLEKRLRHPAVRAILDAARTELFG